MIKEDYYRDLQIFSITHPFAELRKSDRWGTYLHGGDDLVSEKGKQQDLFNLITGVISSFGTGRDYGCYLLTKHNPRFANGVDDIFYGLYCHMHEIDDYIIESNQTKNKFINSGMIIGKMGNTGNCWTHKMTGGYRPVTEKEVKNPNSIAGVHLHNQFHQIADQDEITPLLKELKNRGIVKDNPYNYFWQLGKLFYNPKCIMTYFKQLQGRKTI